MRRSSRKPLSGWSKQVGVQYIIRRVGKMPKYKVTATMDVGYTAIIEADSQDEAWTIARNGDEADWEQTDNGHDWTLENIREVKENENHLR
jgi:hypothetical protein